LRAIGRQNLLAREYAKCKNRLYILIIRIKPDYSTGKDRTRATEQETMNDISKDPAVDAMPMTETPAVDAAPKKILTPAAQRALSEAEARRAAAEPNSTIAPKEFQGPEGPEPTRYGDWERKGIASDF
jgi:hypothetical protein